MNIGVGGALMDMLTINFVTHSVVNCRRLVSLDKLEIVMPSSNRNQGKKVRPSAGKLNKLTYL